MTKGSRPPGAKQDLEEKHMKYIVVLCDGMADTPSPALGGKTPMEAAHKPNMDYLARMGRVGLVKTVADGLKPGSDVANLSVLGYDPMECYTGRSPLEAASIGIDLGPEDLAFRCNLVTLSEVPDYESRTMVDYCAGDISTEEAEEIIHTVQEKLGGGEIDFYPGIQYRHCMVWHGGDESLEFLTPPHDISDRVITEYLPQTENGQKILALMKRSAEILKDHPVNQKRIAAGKRPANSIWLWGQGKRPVLENFQEKYGKKGSIVSAVDLIKGIGKCAEMTVCEVEGATGYIDTNFEGKAEAALRELSRGQDFVYVHLEAPDECGHRGEPENKVTAIELIDEKILGAILSRMPEGEDYRVMVLPDHPTPLAIKTHSSNPVPFLMYQKSREADNGISCFTEAAAREAGWYVEHGPSLMEEFLNGEK